MYLNTTVVTTILICFSLDGATSLAAKELLQVGETQQACSF